MARPPQLLEQVEDEGEVEDGVEAEEVYSEARDTLLARYIIFMLVFSYI